MQYNTKKLRFNAGIFISFWKKGYCHIDGKVYTFNFCPGSEIVCPTFPNLKITRQILGHAHASPGPTTHLIESGI